MSSRLVDGQTYSLDEYRQLYLGHLSSLGLYPTRRLTQQKFDDIYKNVPRVGVDSVIVSPDNKSVLLVQRGIPPGHQIGAWHLPGGGIRKYELLDDAVKRKAKEEVGLDVKVERLIGVYGDPLNDVMFWTRTEGWQVVHDPEILAIRHSIAITYLARERGGTLRGSPEGRELRFFSFDALPDRIGFHHKRVLDDCRNQLT